MIDLIIIGMGTLAGLIFIKRIEPAWFAVFVPYLFITFTVEFTVAKNWFGIQQHSNLLYNIFTSFEFCFYFWLFFKSFKTRTLKKAALVAIPVFLAIAAVNIIFIQGYNRFHTISYRIATLAIVFFCYRYYRQLLSLETEVNVLRTPMFWVASGLLFFYAGFFFYFSAFDYVAYTKSTLNLQVWKILSRSLNVLLYSFFFIAITCNLKPSNYSR
jgi:hypothetical protein